MLSSVKCRTSQLGTVIICRKFLNGTLLVLKEFINTKSVSPLLSLVDLVTIENNLILQLLNSPTTGTKNIFNQHLWPTSLCQRCSLTKDLLPKPTFVKHIISKPILANKLPQPWKLIYGNNYPPSSNISVTKIKKNQSKTKITSIYKRSRFLTQSVKKITAPTIMFYIQTKPPPPPGMFVDWCLSTVSSIRNTQCE